MPIEDVESTSGVLDLGLKYVIGPDGTKTLTIPDDRRALAVAYIRENALKPPGEIEAIVQDGHDQLLDAVAGVSELQAARKPSADDWSVLELIAHVVTTKQIVAALCLSLGEGHWPPGFSSQFEEESAQDGVTVRRFATLSEARAAAEAAHQNLVASIRRPEESTNIEITFRHFVFGALNAREWAVFQRIHDGDHTPQIARIKASPGFPVG